MATQFSQLKKTVITLAIALAATAGAQAQTTITTTSLPDGVKGVAYSATLTATSSAGIASWQLDSGTLPNGLTLNTATGVISGTPTTVGT